MTLPSGCGHFGHTSLWGPKLLTNDRDLSLCAGPHCRSDPLTEHRRFRCERRLRPFVRIDYRALCHTGIPGDGVADESETTPRGRSGEGCLCIRTIDEVWLVKAAIVGRQGGSAVAWLLSALACPHVMICLCLTCWRGAAWFPETALCNRQLCLCKARTEGGPWSGRARSPLESASLC
jgi:hypothetical protein